MNRIAMVFGAAMALLCGAALAQASGTETRSTGVQDNLIYVILYRKGPEWAEGKPMSGQGLRPHGLYMKRLFEEGKLTAAGPLMEANGGLVLTRFRSREEAQAAVEADPAVTGGIFTAEVHAWTIRFSDGTLTAGGG